MENYVFNVSCERKGKSSWYQVKSGFNEGFINNIKSLNRENRKYDSINKFWEIKVGDLFELISKYKKSTLIKFDFGSPEKRAEYIKLYEKWRENENEKIKKIEELRHQKEEWVRFKNEVAKDYVKYSDQVHSYLNPGVVLYPHQVATVLYANKVRNLLISHEMGTGKSLSSITYVEMNGFEKVVVVTPNSLKFNYYNEVEKFTNSKAHIVGWKKNKHTIIESKYVILNYEFFNSGKSEYYKNKWKSLGVDKIDCLIADECQKLKSTKNNTYKNFTKTFTEKIFKEGVVSKLFLSGTPAPNKAHELYSVLNQISSLDFPTKTHFYEYYCGMTYDQYNGWGYVVNDEDTKFEELYHKISPYTHRVRKADVLKDLPDKIYQKVILELSDKDLSVYEDIEKGVANEFVEKANTNPLTIMVRLRQYTSHLKFKPIIDLIDGVIESGEKIIIIDMFKDVLRDLKIHYGEVAGLHTGDQSVEERTEVVKNFQDPYGCIKIFLGSVQTANYGLTLTAASKLFIITLPFSVGEYDQVADRCHRIGQKDVVNIYPMVFRDTIDEYVFAAIEGKRKEILKVLDNEDYKANYNESVMSDVIKKIMNKYGK